MLTLVCHLKKVMHRGWAYFQARLAFTMAAFNVLVQWHGFQPNSSGFVPLSIAIFALHMLIQVCHAYDCCSLRVKTIFVIVPAPLM